MQNVSFIAREAWKLAEQGSLDEAIAKYQHALEIADDATDDLWHIHGEFGAVLARAQQFERAIEEHRASAEAAVGQGRTSEFNGCSGRAILRSNLLHALRKASPFVADVYIDVTSHYASDGDGHA